MADGTPKDYSSIYCEDTIPSHRNISLSNNLSNTHHHNTLNSNSHNHHNNNNNGRPELPPIPTDRGHRRSSYNNNNNNTNNNNTSKRLDGSFVVPKHNESSYNNNNSSSNSNNKSVCLSEVVRKLKNLPKENHDAYAEETLNDHYYKYVERRKTSYKAYIQYFDEKDTYVVRINHNTLRAVKDKMPKRGHYRYFFKGPESTCEEVEFDESVVPTHDKDGLRQIYCQVFPF